MQENFGMSEKIDELAKALSLAQKDFPVIQKNGKNTYFKRPNGDPSTYVILDDLLEGVKPVLSSNGLSLTQLPISVGEYIGVRTMLMHSSGQYIYCILLMKPEKAGAQEIGKIISYIRRYQAGAILGVSTEEDDDGNSVSLTTRPKNPVVKTDSPPETNQNKGPIQNNVNSITERQLKRLFGICKEKGWTINDLNEALSLGWGIVSKKEIMIAQYDEIVRMVQQEKPADAIAILRMEQSAKEKPNDLPPFDLGEIPFG